jgi:hypothetical protein
VAPRAGTVPAAGSSAARPAGPQVVAAEVVRPIATHAAGEMAVAEGGGSTRTAGLLTILAAEASARQAVESIEGVATTSASRGIDTAAVAAEVEDVGISQVCSEILGGALFRLVGVALFALSLAGNLRLLGVNRVLVLGEKL